MPGWTKFEWVEKVTKVVAERLNSQEEGIEEAKAIAEAALNNAGSATVSGIATASVSLATAPRMVGESVASVATETNPRSVVVSFDSRHIYVANYTSATISCYLKGTGGPVLIQTIATGVEPSSIAITPNGKNVYVGDYGASTIHQYERDLATGKLTALGSPTIATGAKTTGIAVGPDGKYAYSVTEGTHTIYQWEIEIGGGLKALGTPTVVPTQTFLQAILVSPDNVHVYVLSSGNAATLAYKKEAGGLLTANSPLTEGVESGPSSFCISADGETVYVACATAGKIVSLARNAGTGTLTKSATTYSVTKAQSVAISADGRSVYCTSVTESTVAQFSRELSGGVWLLTALSPATRVTGSKPRACIVSPDNLALLVVNEASGTLVRYERYIQATVLSSYITLDATVLLTAEDDNVKGVLRLGSIRNPGVSFYVISSNPADTGNVGWGINEAGQALTYQRFTASNMPQSAWSPYSTISLWNKPVPPNASTLVHSESAAIVKLLLEQHSAPQPGNSAIRQTYPTGANKDFAHPVYWAASTDNEFTLKLVGFSKGGSLDGSKLKMPSFAKPANGSDGHMVIIQPDGTEWDFYNSKISGEFIEAEAASKTALSGEGRGKCTAADFALLAGVIRPEEMIGGAINHALFCLTPKVTDQLTFGNEIKKEGGTGSGCYVWPAIHAGGGQTSSEEAAFAAAGQKAPPMGAHLWLEMTVSELEAIANIKPWELTLGKAMIKYGAYIGDRSGGGFGFQFLSERSYAAAGLSDPLYKWAEEQRALTNSGMSTTTEEGINTYVFKPSERIPWSTKLRVLIPPSKSEPI
jgi:6-phosphogluconolactonase (cycloisomerase 2 family)